jgi:hypothetical protein
MIDDRGRATELWYRASAKNVMVCALIWLGEPLLILTFIKWVFHTSATLYLFMVPWAVFGLIMVVRPNWVMRIARVMKERAKRDMERFDKWTPPGFP